jgi:hypothetical protein
MLMSLNYKLIGASAILVFLLTNGLFAQCIFDPSPPCHLFARTPVVFVGTVTRASYSPTYQRGEGENLWNYRDRIAHFSVEETFRGKLGAEVDIVATEILPTPMTFPNGAPGTKSMSDHDCEYKFKEGERYLVYASFRTPNDGTLSVSLNRTAPIANAADDLAYIRGLNGAPPGGRIYGQVTARRQDLSDGGNTKNVSPISQVKVVAEGRDQKYEALTDDNGRFEITGVEPGEYSVQANLPDEFTSYAPHKITVADRGCAQVAFYTEANGRIGGKVFDYAGQPLPKMQLDLALADQKPDDPNPQAFRAYADAEGNYEFKSIPPGRYVMGIRLNAIRDCDFPYSRTYYPNVTDLSSARVFTLKSGEKISGINFSMPQPLSSRTIEGIVIWPDGKPVRQASVDFMISDYSFGMGCAATHPDDSGRFSFTLFSGLSYWVGAVAFLPEGKQMHSEPIDIPAEGDAKNLKLVIESPSGNCERCRFRYGPHKKKPQ